MATEILALSGSPSQTLYPVVQDSAGLYLDFSDDTFKAAGSVVTPSISVTETADANGQQSRYTASLDLSKLNDTLTPSEYYLRWVRQVGASADLTVDTNASDPIGVTVAVGEIDPTLTLEITPNYQQDLDTATFTVVLLVNGKRVSFADVGGSPTCDISVYEEGSALEHLAISSIAVDAQGDFYGTSATPAYVDWRTYEVTATVGPLVVKDTFVAMG